MINLLIYSGCFLFCWLVATIVWRVTRKYRKETEVYETPKVLVENPFAKPEATKEEKTVEMPMPKRKAFRKRTYKKKTDEK